MWAIAALIGVEIGLTLWDFVVEDGSRKLPATERILHTLLAINGGANFGLYAMQTGAVGRAAHRAGRHRSGRRGWVLSLFAVGVAVSGVRDGIGRAAPEALAAAAQSVRRADAPAGVLVTGGTGFIGEALVNQMLDAGHAITVLTRDPLRAAYLFDGRARCVRSLRALNPADAFDAVINLAGAPVVGPRWSPRRQRQLLASRLAPRSAGRLAGADAATAEVWVQGTAIGYYGVRDPETVLDESRPFRPGLHGRTVPAMEAAAAWRPERGCGRWCWAGDGAGPGRALRPLLLPYRFGLGGRLGDGRQVMS